jgi:hypothetical protein
MGLVQALRPLTQPPLRSGKKTAPCPKVLWPSCRYEGTALPGMIMRPDDNCRKTRRIAIQTPVTIKVRDANDVEQIHYGHVIDASKCGLKIRVKRFFPRQTVLFLSIPFPTRFREFNPLNGEYHTYAMIVHSKKFALDDFEIGVKLLHNKLPENLKPFRCDD